MKVGRIAGLAPDWLFTYTGTVLLMALLVNLGTSFASYSHSLTLPSMEASLHLSHTKAGLLITVLGAVRMGSSLASGTLAPRYGSRMIIGFGTLATGGTMLLLGFSQNYAMAMVALAGMGLSTGAALTPMMGLLSSSFRFQDRGLAAGLAATGGSVAFIIAGVVVPVLTGNNELDGWRHSWRVFGVLVVVIGVITLVFVRERPGAPPGARASGPAGSRRGAWPVAAFTSPAVWLVTSLAFLSGWSQNIFTTFFGLYLSQENGVSLATVGQLVVLMGVLSIVSGVLWGRMSDSLGRGNAFMWSYAIQSAVFALLAFAPGMASFIVVSILMGITLRAAYTVCAAASGDYVPVQFSAAAFALMSVGASLGSTISPTIGGAVADHIDMKWSFGLGLAGTVIGALGGLYLQTRKTVTEQAQPVSAD